MEKKKSNKKLIITICCLVLLLAVVLIAVFLPKINKQNTLNPGVSASANPYLSYTWQEYEALSDAEKEAFFESFATTAEFEAWQESAKLAAATPQPWEQNGKTAKDYTWAEYEALTDEQKEAFFESFASADEFEAWKNSAQNPLPWQNGGKQPSEYTWAEYEALSDAQKEAFFESFPTADEYTAWENSATGIVID